MAFPTQAGAPLVGGNFGVFVRGFNVGYFEKVKIPSAKPKKTTVQPAGNAAPSHFPTGLVEYDEAEVDGYQGTDGSLEASIQAWLTDCANAETGVASKVPEAAKRPVTVVQYDTNGAEIHEWLLVGAFPTDTGGIELAGGDEKKVTRAMKLSVDRVKPVR